MKKLKAVIRPEIADSVADALGEAGFNSLTRINAFGRGKQNGIVGGSVHYNELPKVILMLILEDSSIDEVVKIIKYKAYTGNYGDGKIFISPVERVITVRTGETGL